MSTGLRDMHGPLSLGYWWRRSLLPISLHRPTSASRLLHADNHGIASFIVSSRSRLVFATVCLANMILAALSAMALPICKADWRSRPDESQWRRAYEALNEAKSFCCLHSQTLGRLSTITEFEGCPITGKNQNRRCYPTVHRLAFWTESIIQQGNPGRELSRQTDSSETKFWSEHSNVS